MAHQNILKRPLFTAMILVGLIYAVLNVYSSQTVHPLYFQLASDENAHAVAYLSAIKTLPQFEKQFQWYAGMADEDLHDRVFHDNLVRAARITQLELILAKNPDAPQVLNALSQLHSLQGNKLQAELYRNRAQQIDPGVQ